MPAIAWPSNRVAYSAYAATVAAVLVAVNVVVPEPYMVSFHATMIEPARQARSVDPRS